MRNKILCELHDVAFVFELLVDRRPLAAKEVEAEEQSLFIAPVERLVERDGHVIPQIDAERLCKR